MYQDATPACQGSTRQNRRRSTLSGKRSVMTVVPSEYRLPAANRDYHFNRESIRHMILAFWRAFFQAIAIGLVTFGLITGVEFILTGHLAAIQLYAWTSLGVGLLVFIVRFITLVRCRPGAGTPKPPKR